MKVALAFCVASAACAQTPGLVFHFTSSPDSRSLQEIVTTLHSVARIQEVSLNIPSATISVDGTPDQVAAAEWLLHELDRPAQTQNQQATFGGDIYLVYRLKNTTTPIAIQEIITTVRTVGDFQLIYSYTAPRVIILRGKAPEIAMAEWIIRQLDLPAANSAQLTQEYRNPNATDNVIRVFYVPRIESAGELQQIVTAIRTTGRVMKVYSNSAVRAITVRDTEERVGIAQSLISGWQP